MKSRITRVVALTAALLCAPAISANLSLEFEIPSFDTQDYRKPYVSIWAEAEQGNQTLLLWHLTSRKEDKWLQDIRRWWRKAGRYDEPMADGITGATRGPGKYQVVLDTQSLEKFTLYVEVVREDGGRSLLSQAIDIKEKGKIYTLPADAEVGPVTIQVGR